MAFVTQPSGPLHQATARLRPRLLGVIGILFLAGGLYAPDLRLRLVLILVALTILMIAFWLRVSARAAAGDDSRAGLVMAELLDCDAAPSFVTGEDGTILYSNTAAGSQYDCAGAENLTDALRLVLASPGPILFRLQSRARAMDHAQEDLVTRQGHVHLTVHRVGDDRFFWRIEKSADRPQRDTDPVPLPMFTVGRNDAVLFMNAAARALVGERVRTLDRICPQLPLKSGQFNDISTPDGAVPCMVVELEGTAGRREVFLLPGGEDAQMGGDGWAFFDDLPVPLLKLARDGEIQLSNRPARELLGIDSSAGRAMADTVEGLGRSLADWLDEVASGRGTARSEVLRIRRDDREVFVQVTLNRMIDDGTVALIAVLNDATELKTLEAQFVQSQKMQAIGQLAGGVAHDFNNLLTAISGHCDLLLLRHDQGDGDFGDLVQISQNANRAAALVNQLLAYSRKQTLRPEVMDMRDALSDLTHLLNRLVGEKVTLSLSHDPGLWPIRADKRQIEQVLMNLVVNARDAMPGGGDIAISTENLLLEDPLERDRAVVAPGRYVTVAVVDQGVGIAPDKLQKIFEPFYTTKRVGEGTGLGLSTAYGIVKQTGGFIFADSEAGRGTRFRLLFPAIDPVAEETVPAPANERIGDPAEGVVLLVEDEAPVRAFASRALQMRGFSVLEAESAEDALELLADETLQVDVFVTDVVMPGRDGPSWVQEALQSRPGVSVVFVSGYAEETFGDVQSKIPNSVFLPKPFSLTDLTETVQRRLN